MSRATTRILGNISVFLVLAGLVLLLVMAALSPDFLKNDVKLTAEAKTGTPSVQASPSPTTSQPKISGENARLAAWALKNASAMGSVPVAGNTVQAGIFHTLSG